MTEKKLLNESRGTFVPSPNAEPPPMPSSLVNKQDAPPTEASPEQEPQVIDVGNQPTSLDRFNYGSNLIAKALALSKKNQFKPVALSFTDLEFLQHVINAGVSAAVQYSNVTAALLKRDPELSNKIQKVLETSNLMIQNLSSMRVDLTHGLELAQQIVKPRPVEPTEAPVEAFTEEEPPTTNSGSL
jgi:hypothetical protein